MLTGGMCQTFEPQLDPLPAIAAAFVFAAFVAVQTTVRRAMSARERREAVEVELKQGRLRQLQGGASLEEVKELEQRLEQAFEAEQSAAEFFVSQDLRIRVRVPRPLGTPLENLTDDESIRNPERPRKGAGGREPQDLRGGNNNNQLLNSKTTLVATVAVILIWSLIGMSSDPMAPPPEWLQDMGSSM
mmetsp:Transcript_29064/g.72816  ORF Transcript_29064/g.72816 Transcript_29064/m.72816 type:complete len:188 (-) Transcript_29064:305-868(-)